LAINVSLAMLHASAGATAGDDEPQARELQRSIDRMSAECEEIRRPAEN